jgi:hypothetical protein
MMMTHGPATSGQRLRLLLMPYPRALRDLHHHHNALVPAGTTLPLPHTLLKLPMSTLASLRAQVLTRTATAPLTRPLMACPTVRAAAFAATSLPHDTLNLAAESVGATGLAPSLNLKLKLLSLCPQSI